MSHRVVAIVVALAMLWQAVPFARIAMAHGALGDAMHSAHHWIGEAHHHHGDGDYHQDESAASVKHIAADHAGGAFTLPSKPSAPAPLDTSDSIRPLALVAAPDPVLDGPLRPPRPAA